MARRLAEHDPFPALSRRARLAMTIGPFAGLGLILMAALVAWGYGASAFLAAMLLGSFVGGGKFVIFGGLPAAAPLGVWWLAGLVVYGDLGTALVLMANMSVFYRVPVLGRRLAACHEAGWHVLRTHRWMRRAAWLGVAVFVAAPFQGSGAVVGTFLARLLGLSRVATLTAIGFGSAVGCYALAAIGAIWRQRISQVAQDPVVCAIVLGITIAILVVLGRWFMGQGARYREAPIIGPEEPTQP